VLQRRSFGTPPFQEPRRQSGRRQEVHGLCVGQVVAHRPEAGRGQVAAYARHPRKEFNAVEVLQQQRGSASQRWFCPAAESWRKAYSGFCAGAPGARSRTPAWTWLNSLDQRRRSSSKMPTLGTYSVCGSGLQGQCLILARSLGSPSCVSGAQGLAPADSMDSIMPKAMATPSLARQPYNA
jgi:hypothetical protein